MTAASGVHRVAVKKQIITIQFEAISQAHIQALQSIVLWVYCRIWDVLNMTHTLPRKFSFGFWPNDTVSGKHSIR